MVVESEIIPALDEDYLDAQDVFFYQFNDIDIYVEDIDQEELYLEILSKILPYRIGKIFPLGGKSKVITKANCNTHTKRKIFIVDKDFDDLHGNMIRLPNLFYLNKYSIENYLVTKNSIIQFLKEEFPRLSVKQIERELNFDQLFNNTISELMELFLNFYLIQKLGLPMENCSCPVDRFLDDVTGRAIDHSKCELFFNEILIYCELFGLQTNVAELKSQLHDRFRNVSDAEPHIPGKHLLNLFLKKTSGIFSFSRMPNRDSLYFRLAKNSNFENLSTIREGIISYQS